MRELLTRVIDWFRRDRLDAELQEELRFHREHLERDAMRAGAAPADATFVAKRQLGSSVRVTEQARDAWSFAWFDQLSQDVRYAWRGVVRTPALSMMIVVTLALGVGVNAAMFSFLDRIYLRPPAGVAESDNIRRLWINRFRNQLLTHDAMNHASFAALRAVAPDSALAMYITEDGMHIGREKGSPPVHGVFASANYFGILGVTTAMGRFYGPDEDIPGSGANVVVVSHDFWESRLSGAPDIIGKPLTLGKTTYTIIGVMQRGFTGTEIQAADVWFPLGAFPGKQWDGTPWFRTSSTWGARTLMRVPLGFADGGFEEQGTEVLRRVEKEMRGERADDRISLSLGPIIAARGPGELSQETKIATRVAGVAVIVLLIAGGNVINLLLARAMRRRREIAIRLALGVSRFRLMRLLTAEALVLALLAGVAALLTAVWTGTLLRSLLLPNIEWSDSPFDARVLAFTMTLALVAGLVAGIIPALQNSRPELGNALKEGARDSGGRSPLRTGLVMMQAALSVVLLVGASLFVRSLGNVSAIDIGYDVDRTLAVEVQFEDGEAPAAPVRAAAMRELGQRLATRPGVEAVGQAGQSPMRGYGVQQFILDGEVKPRPFSSDVGPLFAAVDAGYFAASGLDLLRGRLFTSASTGAKVNEVVINDVTAATLFPGVDPLGRCVRFTKVENPCHVVVGVVESSNAMDLIERKKGHFYVPFGSHAGAGWDGTALVVRVRPDAVNAVKAEAQRGLTQAFPLGYPNVLPLRETLEPEYRPWKLGATLFTAFAMLALVVALVGIYSTVAYSVRQRMHEFGVRVALGASLRDVLSQVLGEGMRVVGAGVAVGIVLALAAGKLVRSLLFGVETTDLSAMLLAGCTLLVVAALAALAPAWRAARVDPVTALRSD